MIKNIIDSVFTVIEKRDFKSVNIVTVTLFLVMVGNIYAIAHLGFSYFNISFLIFDPTLFIPLLFICIFSFWSFQKHFDGAVGFLICTALTLVISYITALLLHGVYTGIASFFGMM